MKARLLVAIVFAVVLASPRPAQADDTFLIAALLVGPPIAVSTSFTIYDAVLAARDEPSPPAMGWAHVLGAGPQAVFLTSFGTVGAVDDDGKDGGMVIGMVAAPFSMMTTALLAHGIWTLANEDPDPAQVFFTSSAIGINAPLTIFALGAGFAGGLSSPSFAVMQLVATSPVIGGSAYHLAIAGSHPTDAIVMTAWSSTLFVHGALSLMLPELAVDFKNDNDLAIFPTIVPDASPNGRAPGLLLTGSLR